MRMSKLSQSTEARLSKEGSVFDTRDGEKGAAVAGQAVVALTGSRAAGVFFGAVLSETGVHAGSNCWIQGCLSSLATEARLAGSCRTREDAMTDESRRKGHHALIPTDMSRACVANMPVRFADLPWLALS